MRPTVTRPRVPFRPLLAGVLVAALAVPSLARAEDDEEEVSGSVNMNGGFPGLGGFNMNVTVKDGTSKKQGGVVTGTSTRREEYSSNAPGQAFKLIYEESGGATRFKFLAPEGLGVKVSDGAAVVLQEAIPASVDVTAGKFYRVEVFTPQAVVFDRKFEAKAGMVGSLWVTAGPPPSTNVQVTINAPPPPPVYAAPPPPPAPAPVASCMGADDLGSIKEAIEGEGFSDGKVGVLESAAADRWFCVAQVIEVLELFPFSEDKLKALRIMKPRIIDPKNNFKVIGALTFSSDKEAAKKILQ